MKLEFGSRREETTALGSMAFYDKGKGDLLLVVGEATIVFRTSVDLVALDQTLYVEDESQ